MKIIKGDLIELAKNGEFDVIVHGCNCFCSMGRGIAKSVREQFPLAFEADLKTQKADRSKMGSCSYATFQFENQELTVINAYTQYHWNGDGVEVLADYDAIRRCMQWIKVNFSGKRIGVPKIGAGLARGDWGIISKILDEELDGEDLTLVEFV